MFFKQVFSLLDQLPDLKMLCLNSVILTPPTRDPLPFYPNLHILVLNRTKISWQQVIQFIFLLYYIHNSCLFQVLALRPVFRNLQELHLSSNAIPQFVDKEDNTTDKVTGFDELTLINLEDNQITDWNEIVKFSQLPK